jgi:uncharacterized protein (TIGR00369 family)
LLFYAGLRAPQATSKPKELPDGAAIRMELSDEKASLVHRVTALPGYTSAVGTRILHVGKGTVVTALHKRPDLLQFNGYFHGGVISGLADHAAGAAVTTTLPEGFTAITIDLNVHFLAPANGGVIIAKARAVVTGKTVCVAAVDVATVTETGERSCALATATLRVVQMPEMPDRV